ncbi:hypothetical protein CR513_55579, partial [Mucuna pruriens]
MYEGATSNVRTPKGKRKNFPIVLGVLIRDIQKIILNYMLFMNNIILIEKSREAINLKLEI